MFADEFNLGGGLVTVLVILAIICLIVWLVRR